MAHKREFYIPEQYTEKREGPTKGTEIFLFTDKKGRPCAKGFRGRAQKTTFNYFYANEGRREDSIARWIDGETKEANIKQERRDRLNKPHSLKIGDILCSSWGWEQTNVDFYEVTTLPSKCFVELRKLSAPISEMGGMQGKTAPLKGEYTSGGRLMLGAK